MSDLDGSGLDPGIRDAVMALRGAGVDTCQSCEGGAGHAYSRPTIDFLGLSVPPWEVFALARRLGLPVRELRQQWGFHDETSDAPSEMVWQLVLQRPDGGYQREYPRVLNVRLINGAVVVFEDEALAPLLVDDAREFARRILAACDSVEEASPEPEPIGATEPPTRCTATLGRRPEWMGVDQYDPCRCRLDAGHEPVAGGENGHWCEHLDMPDPRLAAPSVAPAPPSGEERE